MPPAGVWDGGVPVVSAPICRTDIPHWQRALIKSGKLGLLTELSDAPFHVLCPQQFAQTLSDWHITAKEIGLPFGIRFGKKANKSVHFSREIALSILRGFDSGIDVASVEEFQSALAAGVLGKNLVVTGPTPNRDLIYLALCHDAVMTLSNEVDAASVGGFVDGIDTRNKLRVLFRIATASSTTRFGMSTASALDLTARVKRYHANIDIVGVSFHCNGYDLDERITMSHLAIDTLIEMRSLSAQAETISIGGGFPTAAVDFIAWRNLQLKLQSDMFIDSAVPENQYPFGAAVTGRHALRYIASQPRRARQDLQSIPHNQDSVAQRARRHRIKLLAEPGRALCQSAGASFFPVLSCHFLPNAARAVTVVRGTSFSISEQWFNSEYYPDPYLIRDGVVVNAGVATATAVAGSTCLDSDYLSKRMIQLPDRPRPGDLLVYPDTAGYQMDSNESPFHEYRLPQKYAFYPDTGTLTEDR